MSSTIDLISKNLGKLIRDMKEHHESTEPPWKNNVKLGNKTCGRLKFEPLKNINFIAEGPRVAYGRLGCTVSHPNRLQLNVELK